MAVIPTDIKSNIDTLYNKRKDTQLQQLRDSQKKAVGEINAQKKTTDQDYYDKRNQADVVNMQNRRSLEERMASLGQTGANVSGQIALQASRQNTLGDLNEQEQGIMNAYNRQINDINDPSKERSIISEIESARSQALAQALERAIERQKQQEQFDKQLSWEKEKFNRQMAEQAKARAARLRKTSNKDSLYAPAESVSQVRELPDGIGSEALMRAIDMQQREDQRKRGLNVGVRPILGSDAYENKIKRLMP